MSPPEPAPTRSDGRAARSPTDVARPRSSRGRLIGTTVALLLVLAVGWLDFFTGTELRVYPLYFVAIVVAGWAGGHTGAAIVALASMGAWTWFNLQAGMTFQHPWIWPTNAGLQLATFLFVGWLFARQQRYLQLERRMARFDALTGLANARYFRERAVRALDAAGERGEIVTVAYVDLDSFKAVNDRLGHEAGDRVLATVADVLLLSTRGGDVVGRLGGDEFGLVLPSTDQAGAEILLGRIRERIHAAMVSGDLPVRATVGAVVCGPSCGRDLHGLLREADTLMYDAKRDGKDRLLVRNLVRGDGSPHRSAGGARADRDLSRTDEGDGAPSNRAGRDDIEGA